MCKVLDSITRTGKEKKIEDYGFSSVQTDKNAGLGT